MITIPCGPLKSTHIHALVKAFTPATVSSIFQCQQQEMRRRKLWFFRFRFFVFQFNFCAVIGLDNILTDFILLVIFTLTNKVDESIFETAISWVNRIHSNQRQPFAIPRFANFSIHFGFLPSSRIITQMNASTPNSYEIKIVFFLRYFLGRMAHVCLFTGILVTFPHICYSSVCIAKFAWFYLFDSHLHSLQCLLFI